MTGTPENTHHVGKYGPVKEFGYKEFYNGMTGEAFDPEEWAELVVRSGAKYAGPVTEHADNFSTVSYTHLDVYKRQDLR